MRVIEDNQDKMTEGEYLDAMNALAALHREVTIQQQPPQPPAGPPPSYQASAAAGLFASQLPEVMNGNRTEAFAWQRVRNHHPDPYTNRITAEQWLQTPYVERFRMLREATEYIVRIMETTQRTPEPSVCPFITRHAVGLWSMEEDDGNTNWECVCGYTGKVKNWKKHEQSERHQDWAKHRTVSRRKIEKMKAMNRDDEVGNFTRFAGYGPNPDGLYPGGIRVYTVWQDKNEWTHPELFAEFHRSPAPVFQLDEAGNLKNTTMTQWFVHRRNILATQHIQ